MKFIVIFTVDVTVPIAIINLAAMGLRTQAVCPLPDIISTIVELFHA